MRVQRGRDSDERASTGLDPVLRPNSVAVIGASRDPTKRGHRAVRALLSSYRGRIIPVHPNGGSLLGLPVATGPADLDEPPDLLLVCTPAPTVPGVLTAWGDAGARGAVVLAVGFRETGEAGEQIEWQIAEVARATGLRVVGPNTSGLLNLPLGLNLIGLDGVSAGPIALLVQSGNLALALTTEAARAGLGFTFVIGVGNEADIRFDEYLDFLTADADTRAVAIHTEGFRDGRAFLAAAARAALVKPVVAIKGGRTEAGGAAARSHTGAVAGSYDAFRAGLRQAGVIEVKRTDELIPTLAALVGQSRARARGVAVLSDGGGHATIAADDLHARGAPLASLAPETSRRLRELLGTAAAVANPVDLAGAADRDPATFARALEVIVQDPAVGAVLVVGLFGGYAIRFDASLLASEVEAAQRMPAMARDANVALVVHSLYPAVRSEPLRILRNAGVAVIESVEVACRAVAATTERLERLERIGGVAGLWLPDTVSSRHGAAPRSSVSLERGGTPRPGADAFTEAHADGRRLLLEPEARALVEPFGVPIVPARFCRDAAEARAAARAFGTKLAVRVVAAGAPHKTEAGGVELDVEPDVAAASAERVRAAVEVWCAARGEIAGVRGVLISPMLSRPIAELLAGVRRDPEFGPVLIVAAGGTAVEWLGDVATRVVPVEQDDVMEMLHELRISTVLHGQRGGPAADLPAIVAAIGSFVDCVLAHPDISEAEINPLFVYADGVVAVDVRVFID